MFMSVAKLVLSSIYTEGKSLAIYFEDSQFRRNRTFNFIVSKIFVIRLL